MDNYRIYNIPSNYTSGVSFFGKMFPVRNVIEAGIAAAAGVSIVFLLKDLMQFTVMISVMVCTVILSGVIVLPGIKGSSFMEYMKLLIAFKKGRRVLMYNPRVKTEAVPVRDERELVRDAELPRDKILKLINRAVSPEESTEITLPDRDRIVFADDMPAAKKTEKKKPVKPAPEINTGSVQQDADLLPDLVIPKRKNA